MSLNPIAATTQVCLIQRRLLCAVAAVGVRTHNVLRPRLAQPLNHGSVQTASTTRSKFQNSGAYYYHTARPRGRADQLQPAQLRAVLVHSPAANLSDSAQPPRIAGARAFAGVAAAVDHSDNIDDVTSAHLSLAVSRTQNYAGSADNNRMGYGDSSDTRSDSLMRLRGNTWRRALMEDVNDRPQRALEMNDYDGV